MSRPALPFPRFSCAVAVGAVGPDSVRLWLRSDVPGPHRLEVWPLNGDGPRRSVSWHFAPAEDADGTGTLLYPGDFADAPPLASLRRHGFRITREADGTLVGEGRFDTAPALPEDTPPSFSFGLLSCHQPFLPSGAVRPASEAMLEATRRTLESHDARFLLLGGDQVYVDEPPALSLFAPEYFHQVAPPGRARLEDCSAAEVRRLYQHRYRQFWDLPGWRGLLADYPTWPMIDDHEVVNNWGAEPEHAGPTWRQVDLGARAAYFDYQASRVLGPAAGGPPATFDFSFDYGSTGIYAMDLRSQRRGGEHPRVYSPEQLARLSSWLEAHQDSHAVFLLLSVPMVYVASWASVGISLLRSHRGDARDRWTHPWNLPDRDRLLALLLAHQRRCPAQRVVLLSGDVHLGCAFAIDWLGDSHGTLYQFTSSAVTHHTRGFSAWAAGHLPRTEVLLKVEDGPVARLVRMDGVEGADHNPYSGLNVGVVEVKDRGPHSTVRFKLVGQDPRRPDRPVTVFDTGEL
ncbi:alkaline phosphatase D family protein [Pyxidicoccus xibeiensis]|uniref:alkaline phosphatase D family protein n=1 Tax=Pyxidicoccus xibeiensis TaxID=2906759 RepID=UPI0020A7C077|nr:alkaline phosphatase D family protein [Pyxidicoccus xibeiensis]MCP3137128.1 alkaline phosphatase D family protein [Pyxidicoccus xibeiensis]